jgi:multidrug resistance efflux pump
MQTQLYPAEYAEDSLERLLAERSRRSHVLYLAAIATLLAALATLPLARVDVSIQSTGIIRPVTEKHEVKARASGLVEQRLVRENGHVRAGQPMLVLRSAAIGEQRRLLAAQIDEHQRSIADLEMLAKAARAGAASTPFQTPRYAQAWAQFRNDVSDAEERRQCASREAQRTHTLGAGNVAAPMDVEEKDFQLAQACAALALVRDKYLSQWQGELAQARTELTDFIARRRQADEELNLYTVTAPVTGTVDEMPGVSSGSFVTAGEAIAVISPSSELQAEVYVSPRDIGRNDERGGTL